MIFNSLEFASFFAAFYLIYLALLRWRRPQNLFVLISSYFFYGWWDWRFLSLIAISTIVDYTIGSRMAAIEEDQRRKRLLWVSVGTNLSILGFFKYFNFFSQSTVEALNSLGLQVDALTLEIVLPVGISFYTFQTLSYTIDIYRKRLEPTRDFIDFALFVAFFPQLVAGPIERAAALLPQIAKPRSISWGQLNAGLFLVIWGLFKKIVIADNVAVIANAIFNHHHRYEGLDLLVGTLAFTVQIYGDFSGYSDIARGISKMMGFELMVNFKLPYLARTPSEFWQRWHISLSGWLRDYLYISLGGNRGGESKTLRNLLVTMLLGGLWHGAAWNFVLWGAYHGGVLVLYRLFDKGAGPPPAAPSLRSRATWLLRWSIMSMITLGGWILFRAHSMEQIGHFFSEIWWGSSSKTAGFYSDLLFFSWPLIPMQIYQYYKHDLLAPAKLRWPLRGLLYGLMVIWMLIFGVREATEFIYFQF